MVCRLPLDPTTPKTCDGGSTVKMTMKAAPARAAAGLPSGKNFMSKTTNGQMMKRPRVPITVR